MIAFRKAFTGPKSFFEVSLSLNGKNRGEVITQDFAIPQGTPLQVVSLRIKPDMEWIPKPLRVEGCPDGRYRLGQ